MKETKQCCEKCYFDTDHSSVCLKNACPCHQQEEQKKKKWWQFDTYQPRFHVPQRLEFPNKPLSKGWGVDFSEKFSKKFGDNVNIEENKNVPMLAYEISDFIEKTLLAERAKVVEEIRQDLEKIRNIYNTSKTKDYYDLVNNIILSLTEKHK